jgi:ABC-type lipoprotein release transport system permease subunit
LLRAKGDEGNITDEEKTYFWKYWGAHFFVFVLGLQEVLWNWIDILVLGVLGATITSVIHIAWIDKDSSKGMIRAMGWVVLIGVGQFLVYLAVGMVDVIWSELAQSYIVKPGTMKVI